MLDIATYLIDRVFVCLIIFALSIVSFVTNWVLIFLKLNALPMIFNPILQIHIKLETSEIDPVLGCIGLTSDSLTFSRMYV